METNEKIRIIKDSFEELRARRIIKTQGDFAELLGISAKSLSAAKNGVEGYCTDSLISKIQGLMKEYDRSISVTNSPGTNVVNGDNNNVEILSSNGISAMAAPYQNIKCVPTIPIHAYRALNFDVMEYFRNTNDDVKMSPIIMQFPAQIVTISLIQKI